MRKLFLSRPLETGFAGKLLRIGAGMTFFSELDRDEYNSLRHRRRDGRAPCPLTNVIYSEMKAVIGTVLRQRLDARKRLVLELRFGLGDGRECTLEQVAERLGITRERVRQIQVRAIARLDVSELKKLTEIPPEENDHEQPGVKERTTQPRKRRGRQQKKRRK